MAVFPSSPPAPNEEPYVYDVATPSSSLAIAHNLGTRNIMLVAYDEGGELVQVGVQVLDENTVQITTVPSLAFSGRVLIVSHSTGDNGGGGFTS